MKSLKRLIAARSRNLIVLAVLFISMPRDIWAAHQKYTGELDPEAKNPWPSVERPALNGSIMSIASEGSAGDLLGTDGQPISRSADSDKDEKCQAAKRQMSGAMRSKEILIQFCDSQNQKMKDLGLRYCPKDSCFVSQSTTVRDPIEIFLNAWSSDYYGNPGFMVGMRFTFDRVQEAQLNCTRVGKETFTLDEIEEYNAYVDFLSAKLECALN